MAYAAGFKHDLFISYAWHDDLLEDARWISNLRESVTKRTENLLGARDEQALKVFWDDRDADRTADVHQDILQQVEQSAILVIMLSPQYIASEACRAEREHFIQSNRGIENCRHRVFVVHVLDARDKRPAEIENEIGYQFCTFEGPASETYGFPERERADERYQQQLNRLRTDLMKRLQELARERSQTPDATSTPAVTSSMADEFTIFVSESGQHPAERQEVTDFLTASSSPRFRILPKYRYDRGREKHIQQIQEDLNQTKLFVGFLGEQLPEPYPTVEEGYEELQWKTAQEMEVPSIRWRPDSLDLNRIGDNDHRVALEQCEAALPSAFCDLILERVQRLLLPEPPDVSPGNKYVVLRAHHDDDELASRVVDELLQRSVSHDVAFDDEPIEQLTEQEFDGFFFLYGRCAAKWLKSEARSCMKRVQSLVQRGKVVGILDPPPPPGQPTQKQRLLFKPRGFRRLTSVEEVVAALANGGTPA